MVNLNEFELPKADDWASLDDRLVAALKPFAPPVAISFRAAAEPGAPRLPDRAPPPNERGRTGQVPAGCVYWVHGAKQRVSTEPRDHANCSVGSYTHGLLSLEEASTKDDVGAVLASGWVSQEAVIGLPRLSTAPAAIVYEPLRECTGEPDVVLVRIGALALMSLHSAVPDLRIEGKPQCHIIALAKEQGLVAASVGCALSRARTGMKATEMTCAIPTPRLREVVGALESTVELDRAMARYAAADAQRFQATGTQ